jgi:hypothetical protein
MMHIHKQKENKLKIDSYDVHVHPIQFQLYDNESVCDRALVILAAAAIFSFISLNMDNDMIDPNS